MALAMAMAMTMALALALAMAMALAMALELELELAMAGAIGLEELKMSESEICRNYELAKLSCFNITGIPLVTTDKCFSINFPGFDEQLFKTLEEVNMFLKGCEFAIETRRHL